MKYIKDDQKLNCPNCHYSNEVHIPIHDRFIAKEAMRRCDECGTIFYYDITVSYKIKNDLEWSLGTFFTESLQDIKSEKDLCNKSE